MALLERARASLRYRTAKASWTAFETAKPIYQTASRARPEAHLFIVGCQRSGTTHLERLFRADPRTTVFGEFSSLSIAPRKTVWRPLEEIRADLAACRGRYTVARSLLISDRIGTVLDAVPRSSAIWVWRDMRPVVASMIGKWGGSFRAVSEAVERDRAGRWALADLWARIEDEARMHTEEDAGEDALGSAAETASGGAIGTAAERRAVWNRYALYWLYRNEAFARTALARDPRITLLGYDTLLADPEGCVGAALAVHAIAPPRLRFPLHTAERARRRPFQPLLAEPIARRCDAMARELRALSTGGGA